MDSITALNTACKFNPERMRNYDYSDYGDWPDYIRVDNSSRVTEIYLGSGSQRADKRAVRLQTLIDELTFSKSAVRLLPEFVAATPLYEATEYLDMFSPRHELKVPVSLSLLMVEPGYYDLVPHTQVYRKLSPREL